MSNYDEQKTLELKKQLVLCNPLLNPIGFIDHVYGKNEIQKIDTPIVRYETEQIDKQIAELQSKKLSMYPKNNYYTNSGLRV